ncbi:uncharacterized protein LOC125042713 [Penaeus chinensis]|uniref:uncharacterized protein LOC125042713 n=1 Tax=Penaeus chinensis TaxID=139456 RepID=UPI001FB80D85|nr:uncharacterized protein LOC125042713 [Penaeus chinensis]XP_047494489.1 uncharacterized protein LOC125042713 [Penaeus chinensis]XP_047494490.1 uncharacterized protein LOC125042713 [Penaeus chinensis]XP_047494491.1 uncharacterized protein LOC125042713 [Penaeus chinensis]XP_047494492.1 uncharacterized protein LOC125042713 [Penaeus chinensis]XP_047494493.1 uncharacterized protein LOC125042713 [Penaeus chinensis]XP_047494494.1 uncharacterized protein LOC125042713 [Penaeus chinensis]XP_04749449
MAYSRKLVERRGRGFDEKTLIFDKSSVKRYGQNVQNGFHKFQARRDHAGSSNHSWERYSQNPGNNSGWIHDPRITPPEYDSYKVSGAVETETTYSSNFSMGRGPTQYQESTAWNDMPGSSGNGIVRSQLFSRTGDSHTINTSDTAQRDWDIHSGDSVVNKLKNKQYNYNEIQLFRNQENEKSTLNQRVIPSTSENFDFEPESNSINSERPFKYGLVHWTDCKYAKMKLNKNCVKRSPGLSKFLDSNKSYILKGCWLKEIVPRKIANQVQISQEIIPQMSTTNIRKSVQSANSQGLLDATRIHSKSNCIGANKSIVSQELQESQILLNQRTENESAKATKTDALYIKVQEENRPVGHQLEGNCVDASSKVTHIDDTSCKVTHINDTSSKMVLKDNTSSKATHKESTSSMVTQKHKKVTIVTPEVSSSMKVSCKGVSSSKVTHKDDTRSNMTHKDYTSFKVTHEDGTSFKKTHKEPTSAMVTEKFNTKVTHESNISSKVIYKDDISSNMARENTSSMVTNKDDTYYKETHRNGPSSKVTHHKDGTGSTIHKDDTSIRETPKEDTNSKTTHKESTSSIMTQKQDKNTKEIHKGSISSKVAHKDDTSSNRTHKDDASSKVTHKDDTSSNMTHRDDTNSMVTQNDATNSKVTRKDDNSSMVTCKDDTNSTISQRVSGICLKDSLKKDKANSKMAYMETTSKETHQKDGNTYSKVIHPQNVGNAFKLKTSHPRYVGTQKNKITSQVNPVTICKTLVSTEKMAGRDGNDRNASCTPPILKVNCKESVSEVPQRVQEVRNTPGKYCDNQTMGNPEIDDLDSENIDNIRESIRTLINLNSITDESENTNCILSKGQVKQMICSKDGRKITEGTSKEDLVNQLSNKSDFRMNNTRETLEKTKCSENVGKADSSSGNARKRKHADSTEKIRGKDIELNKNEKLKWNEKNNPNKEVTRELRENVKGKGSKDDSSILEERNSKVQGKTGNTERPSNSKGTVQKIEKVLKGTGTIEKQLPEKGDQPKEKMNEKMSMNKKMNVQDKEETNSEKTKETKEKKCLENKQAMKDRKEMKQMNEIVQKNDVNKHAVIRKSDKRNLLKPLDREVEINILKSLLKHEIRNERRAEKKTGKVNKTVKTNKSKVNTSLDREIRDRETSDSIGQIIHENSDGKSCESEKDINIQGISKRKPEDDHNHEWKVNKTVKTNKSKVNTSLDHENRDRETSDSIGQIIHKNSDGKSCESEKDINIQANNKRKPEDDHNHENPRTKKNKVYETVNPTVNETSVAVSQVSSDQSAVEKEQVPSNEDESVHYEAVNIKEEYVNDVKSEFDEKYEPLWETPVKTEPEETIECSESEDYNKRMELECYLREWMQVWVIKKNLFDDFYDMLASLSRPVWTSENHSVLYNIEVNMRNFFLNIYCDQFWNIADVCKSMQEFPKLPDFFISLNKA